MRSPRSACWTCRLLSSHFIITWPFFYVYIPGVSFFSYKNTSHIGLGPHSHELPAATILSLSHVWHFCNPLDCSPPCSSIHWISQAKILEWVAISFSSVPSQPRNQTQVPCIAGRFFINWATREAPQFLHRGANIESNFTNYTLVSLSFSYRMSLSAMTVKWFLWMYLVGWRDALHF